MDRSRATFDLCMHCRGALDTSIIIERIVDGSKQHLPHVIIRGGVVDYIPKDIMSKVSESIL